MKRIISTGIAVLVIVAVLVVGFFFGPVIVSRYRQTEAARAISEGRVTRAIELLAPELDRDPQNTDLRLKLVSLYEQENNYARAEYLLVHGMKELGGQVDLYRRLSAVFVKQDKLQDAVDMLSTISNPFVKETLDKERPAPPALSPTPGSFREELVITADVASNTTCYLSTSGEVPSIATDLYKTPVALPQGQTEIKAATVSADGLVSDWTVGVYQLDDILEVVAFTEPQLEAHVRQQLGKPSGQILSHELQAIKELRLATPGSYTSLSDLRYFTHLTTLELVGTGAHVDITALPNLSELTSVSLRSMGLDSLDLEAFTDMDWLTSLDLTANHIATLGPLSQLKQVQTLMLSQNNILDITPLSGLTKLTTLGIGQNGIDDTAAFADLTQVQSLDLSGNRVRSLSGLTNMTALKTLNLEGNALVSLQALANAKSLTTLTLSHNKELVTLSDLSGLTNLESLYADNCQIEDITPLAPLKALRIVSLNENDLTSVAGLEGAASLTEFSANKNEITSLMPLKSLSKLSIVRVEHNKLPSLTALTNCPALKQVYAFGNPITEKVTFKTGITVYTG